MIPVTSDNIRGLLGDIFFTAETKQALLKYIVPLQGNWWAPTEAKEETRSTWIGYNILYDKNYIRARYITSTDGLEQRLAKTRIAAVHLQIIGKDAEIVANSVLDWDDRQDVIDCFSRFAGQLFYEDRKVVTSSYFQDGQNSTLTQNVDFRFVYLSVIDPKQEILNQAVVNGDIVF